MDKFLKQFEILYKKGIADYNAAKVLYQQFNSGNTELDLDIIVFHLQQCVEKLLKAILSVNGKSFTKTHDLELLFEQLAKMKIVFELDTDLINELNDFAVEGRYAMVHDDLARTDLYFLEVEKVILFSNIVLKK